MVDRELFSVFSFTLLFEKKVKREEKELRQDSKQVHRN